MLPLLESLHHPGRAAHLGSGFSIAIPKCDERMRDEFKVNLKAPIASAILIARGWRQLSSFFAFCRTFGHGLVALRAFAGARLLAV